MLSVRDTTEPLDVRAYDPAPRAADLYPRASIELYPRRGFRGPAMVLDRNVRWLERRGVDEREVSSVIVNEGVWQLCTEPGFRGTCGTFEPGHYARIERDSQTGRYLLLRGVDHSRDQSYFL